MRLLPRKIWVIVALVEASGCATYQPMPITMEAVDVGLMPPDMNDVRLRAGEFKHPLLNPVPFDDRDGLSPDEAAIMAVITNPRLRAVRDRRGLASAQLLQSSILPNPRFSYDPGIPEGKGSDSSVNSLGLDLVWEIASLIPRGARLDAARAHVSSVDLDIAWQEWQVAEAARLHAYRLILARQRLAAAEEAEDSSMEMLADMKRGVALGIKTRPDLLAADTGLQEAASRALNARSTVVPERLALNRALGLPSEMVVALEKGVSPGLMQCPNAGTLCEGIEAGRLDLLALRLGYESQEARVRAAVRSQFPRIDLGLTRDRDTDGIQTVGVGVDIHLPFFDRKQGRIAMERASRKQLFDEYAARLFEARSDINRLVAAIEATRRQIARVDESLSTRDTLADNYRHAVDAGLTDVFCSYEAMRSLYDSRIERIELEQKMIDLGIALEIASGRYGLVSQAGRVARKPEEAVGTGVSK